MGPYGSVRWPDGASYDGEFYSQSGLRYGREAEMHGKGTFVFPNGHKYSGEYVMGKRNGFGKNEWPSTEPSLRGGVEYYEGEFRTDPFGKGTNRWVRNKDKKEITYTVVRDKVGWKCTGTGVWVYKCGGKIMAQIEGQWQDSLPVAGIFTDSEGFKYNVDFNVPLLQGKAANPLWEVWETLGDKIFSHKSERKKRVNLQNPEGNKVDELEPHKDKVKEHKQKEPFKWGEGGQKPRNPHLVQQSNQDEDKVISLDLQKARNGGQICVVPFELLAMYIEEVYSKDNSQTRVRAMWTNNFSLERRIGSGAFGDVFEAVSQGGELFATKRLFPHVRLQGTAEDREAALMCTRREIKVLGAFRHPNIIKLLGHTDIANKASILTGNVEVCLLYELAPRGGLDLNLKSADKAVTLTSRIRVQVAAGIARALNYLHCHDPSGPAFHRDVKSANIAVMADFTAKLIDCGLAKYLPKGQQDGTIMTVPAARLGTPGYMCRKYLDSGKYEIKSEIYAFGVVLMELLVGKLQSNAAEFDLYEEYIENEKDIKVHLDVRAGVWDAALVDGLVDLMHQCLTKHARRIAVMLTVVRRLTDLETRFCRANGRDEVRGELEAHRAERVLAPIAAIERRCQVCFDDFRSEQGYACSRHPEHFLCRTCFGREVEEQISQASRGFFALNDARIVCRQCLPTKAALSDRDVARAVDDDHFARFRAACSEVVESRVYQEQEARLQKQLADLRGQIGSGRQEKVRRHRLAIAERILCLCCPRCGQAFVDFAGCFALECSRCKCGFCAYCLKDCGGDAHRHVVGCSFNTAPGRGVFGRFEVFVRAQNLRRARQLAAYLRDSVPDPAEREAVKEAILPDLLDLKMPLPP